MRSAGWLAAPVGSLDSGASVPVAGCFGRINKLIKRLRHFFDDIELVLLRCRCTDRFVALNRTSGSGNNGPTAGFTRSRQSPKTLDNLQCAHWLTVSTCCGPVRLVLRLLRLRFRPTGCNFRGGGTAQCSNSARLGSRVGQDNEVSWDLSGFYSC